MPMLRLRAKNTFLKNWTKMRRATSHHPSESGASGMVR